MIGILPAAGNASRMHHLPKYLLPIPGGYLLQWHLQQMQAAGLLRIYIGATSGNRNLIHQYLSGQVGVFAYAAPYYETMTQTVISSGFNRTDEVVIFGMPDTYWTDPMVYWRLGQALLDGADVAVALFKARYDQHRQGGMCSVDADRVVEVVDKPESSDFRYIWGALAWRPVYWDCLKPDDPHVGYGLPRALSRGLNVKAVICEGQFWDCGTNERYFECIRQLTEPANAPAHRA